MSRIRVDWARALGPPLFAGRIRAIPEDFVVTEQLVVEFAGAGEHDWLRIRKTGANTHWVAQQLARHARVPERDAGYSGLKDRHAVTEQWFSVRRPAKSLPDWDAFHAEGVEILDRQVHSRKLKRGTHRGNAFRIAVRSPDVAALRDEVSGRLVSIKKDGVPNYFGEQRFGRDGSNIELGQAVIAGRRVSRNKRSIGISAVRSLDFNNELDARIRDGDWNRLHPGDIANLDGTGSVFAVEEVTPELEQRCAEMDIHPCGSLPAIETLRVEAANRPLRMRVRGLDWTIENDALWLEFSLGRGGYATAVLREIARCEPEPTNGHVGVTSSFQR
jgi:tRNA pseudouridine13 synthase